MTRRAYVHRISTRSPDDVSGLERAFDDATILPRSVVAILGKTEGNGCVNDWTRALAARALKDALARRVGADGDAVAIVMSGGTEGALAPHLTVFEVRETGDEPDTEALAVGQARTVALPPEHLGRLAQVDLVADGVRAAMREAGVAEPDRVHFVQIKCPLLTAERIAAAEAQGHRTATRDALKSMGLSRAASALGAATALGEVRRDELRDDTIGVDWSLFSGRASASAGIELDGHEIVVLGRGRGWAGPLRIDHAVMADAIDIEPVRAALARVGLPSAGQLAPEYRGRLAAIFAKAEASSSGSLRGYRHTMLHDSDLSATRHARGFAAGALAALVGHAELYVSGGAEHQGPDGGGPVAVIASLA